LHVPIRSAIDTEGQPEDNARATSGVLTRIDTPMEAPSFNRGAFANGVVRRIRTQAGHLRMWQPGRPHAGTGESIAIP
jgi:hypothetical protein